ncbi:MAG: phage tail sheath subtilisin-like domain-containing protein [Oscillospiraceae bacterium]|jgi:phage tail sheath protein FI|nr:phage tail sheath subtilisin-like domain-containing protein [Oscillospiraceae bacterium]
MAEYLSPGVYVEEVESGSKSIEGVSTSTAGFIGLATRGKVRGTPELVTSFAEYQRKFGGFLSESLYGEYRYLPYSVYQFFQNGGSRCYVMRVAPPDAKAASRESGNKKLLISAKDPGSWGNNMVVTFAKSSRSKTQILEEQPKENKYILKSVAGFGVGDTIVFSDGKRLLYNKVVKIVGNAIITEKAFEPGVADTNLIAAKTISTCEINVQVDYDGAVEKYEFVNLNELSSSFIEKRLGKSGLVAVKFNGGGNKPDEKAGAVGGIRSIMQVLFEEDLERAVLTLGGGSDGSISKIDPSVFMGEDKGPSNRTGLQAFLENNIVSILAIPGITEPSVAVSLVAHCANMGNRMAILDAPKDVVRVDELLQHRSIIDSSYAAMYHPWIQTYDVLDKRQVSIPPSGAIAGIYARSDVQRGVHKAPANENVSCTGLSCFYNKGEQDILNPAGVNLIRSFPGQGFKVWGARTCSVDASFKYINVRRLFIFIEESIKVNTTWAVFEPNNETLWAQVERTIANFLTTVWRAGALAGTTPAEAFFVDVSRNTMSPDDIANGRLICTVGIAPTKPAEFVIFRITQMVEGAGGESSAE